MERFEALLAEGMGREARVLKTHPDAGVLVAFRAGELDERQEAEVMEHVGLCAACADHLLYCAELPAGAERSADFAVRKAWRELEPLIAERERPESSRTAARWWLPIAAAASLASVGLGIRLVQVERALRDLARPQTGAAIVDVDPGAIRDFRAAAVDPTTVVELGPGESSFTLVIPVKVDGFDAYRLAILDGDGDELWVDPDLPVDDLGVANLWLPRAFLDAGEYFIEISAERSGSAPETWVYPLSIRLP